MSTQPQVRTLKERLSSVFSLMKKNYFIGLLIPALLSLGLKVVYDSWNAEDSNIIYKGVMIEDGPESILDRLDKIILLVEAEKYETALKKLEAIQTLYDDHEYVDKLVKAFVIALKGECYLGAGRLTEARDELCECVDVEGIGKYFKGLLGTTYYKLQKQELEKAGESTKFLDEMHENFENALSEPIGLIYRDLNLESPLDHALPPLLGRLDRDGLTHVILIGVGDYDDVDVPDLPYTGDDIARMSSSLIATENNGMRVTYITDRSATKENILSTVQTVADCAMPDDKLLVYFTGHGITYDPDVPNIYSVLGDRAPTIQSDQILLPQDWTNDFPVESGLLVDDVVRVALSGHLTTPPLLVLDVCRTDETDVFDNAPRIRSWTSNYLLPFNSNEQRYTNNIYHDNLSNRFSHSSNLSTYSNWGRLNYDWTSGSVGAYILNAVQDGERAVINKKLKGSVFTHSLADALRETFYENPSGGLELDFEFILSRTQNWIETYDIKYGTSTGTPQIGVYIKKSPATDYCQ